VHMSRNARPVLTVNGIAENRPPPNSPWKDTVWTLTAIADSCGQSMGPSYA